MDARQHARLARLLVASCGGVDEVVRNKVCRLRASRLYETTDPQSGGFMPIDVVADLEAYCGEPIYSRGLVEDRPHVAEHQGAEVEACELTEEAAQIQEIVRKAFEGGKLSARATVEVEKLLCALETRTRGLRAAIERRQA